MFHLLKGIKMKEWKRFSNSSSSIRSSFNVNVLYIEHLKMLQTSSFQIKGIHGKNGCINTTSIERWLCGPKVHLQRSRSGKIYLYFYSGNLRPVDLISIVFKLTSIYYKCSKFVNVMILGEMLHRGSTELSQGYKGEVSTKSFSEKLCKQCFWIDYISKSEFANPNLVNMFDPKFWFASLNSCNLSKKIHIDK